MNKEYKEQYIVVAPYWNVNLVESYLTLQMQLIVVAPYWNVNAAFNKNPFLNKFIVVAPYWNVNIIIRMEIKNNRMLIDYYL